MTPTTIARLQLVAAAVLWSLGSFFMRLLKVPSPLHVDQPALDPVQIAFFRSLFGGLCLLPLVPWKRIRWHVAYLPMVLCFATMNGLYLSAMAMGSAANAILLQNTAPVWVYLVGVYVLKQTGDTGAWKPLALAMTGALVIVLGNWPWSLTGAEQGNQIVILLMAVGSGVMYAGVVTFLGVFRREPSAFLCVVNLLGSAMLLATFVWITTGTTAFLIWLSTPTPTQLVFLVVFGAVQMALPYVLFARSLTHVGTTEAAIVTLIEPLLNPVWAYLLSPETDVPTWWTILGGVVLLAALVWRYWPKGQKFRPDC